MARSLFALSCILAVWVPFSAEGQGRFCERRTELCWSCADLAFGFDVSCAAADVCADGQLCVTRDGVAECHVGTDFCCAAGECERPPGCEGAAVACGTGVEGVPDTCTFLNECPVPIDHDGGVTNRDAGPAPDATVPEPDAGSRDGGPAGDAGARDAGAPPPRDAGAPQRDAGSAMDGAPQTPAAPPRFGGGGGCVCRASPGGGPPGGAALAMVALLPLARRARRASRRRRG